MLDELKICENCEYYEKASDDYLPYNSCDYFDGAIVPDNGYCHGWKLKADKNFIDNVNSLIEDLEDMYCDGWINGWNSNSTIECNEYIVYRNIAFITPWYDGNYYCSNCNGLVHLVYDYCPHCGYELDLRDVL